jgi:purine-binding chemotaxis protein CheW
MSPTAAAGAGRAPGTAQYLTYLLGEEVFAMDIRSVREIIQHGSMTSVPLMPAFVRGVINLRGAVVPVIDVHARFGRPPAQVGKRTCVVIFDAMRDGERIELGLMVDAVSEVITLEDTQVEPPPRFGSTLRREFIAGMARRGKRFVVVLDPARAFDVSEMAELCASHPLAEVP